jgi:NAD(P) transhydrogenase subunit alpha
MKVFVPKERRAGERRVAATPETVRKLIALGLEVAVEEGAGGGAFFADAAYRDAGATIAPAGGPAWSDAGMVLKVAPPTAEEAARLAPGAVLIGFLAPHKNLDVVVALAERKVSALAMELIPRVTRAQTMDALSSQASIAGYKAVLVGAVHLDRYFPLLMTAAGTIPPSRVVIMGAGVAGLQAIATARRLGAVVEVSDIRPAVKEQVESLGGKFIDLPMAESGEGAGGYAREMGEDFLRRQREIVHERVSKADLVITTALIPGRPAPMLVPASTVEAMRPGAVIVDLATEQGGNCELSRPDEEVVHGGVTILGPSNLAASMPHDASTLYSRNVLALVKDFVAGGEATLDVAGNEVIAGALLTHAGEVLHAPTAESLRETLS